MSHQRVTNMQATPGPQTVGCHLLLPNCPRSLGLCKILLCELQL